MAIDAYMYFKDYKGTHLKSESQVRLVKADGDLPDLISPFEEAAKKYNPHEQRFV